MVTEIASSELLASLYLAMKMPTQISGRKWPLSHATMCIIMLMCSYVDRAEQLVMPYLESKQANKFDAATHLINFVNSCKTASTDV